jgi:hypothetical protein
MAGSKELRTLNANQERKVAVKCESQVARTAGNETTMAMKHVSIAK